MTNNTQAEKKDGVEELRKAIRDLDELLSDFLEHEKADELFGCVEALQVAGCKIAGHDWTFDQCGYWQHQYCIECGMGKYPDLARKSCGQLTAEMGRMTEEEFLATTQQVKK